MQSKAFTPNDPGYALNQWHFYNPIGGANIANAWNIANGAGITVGVLDTGITQHPDLDMSLVDDGYDFITLSFLSGRPDDGRAPGGWDPGDWTNAFPWNDPKKGCLNPDNPQDEGHPSTWHGTHVAGTIAELTDNRTGMAGIAYRAKVLPVRVLGHCGGYSSDVADGIEWAWGVMWKACRTTSIPLKLSI